MASLRQKKNRRVKVTKIEEKEIATFYRLQLKDIKLKRLTGEVGVIEFESYQ